MTTPITRSPSPSASGRLAASVRIPPSVRLFHTTNAALACRKNPDLFFNPRRYQRAVALCASCPFLARCSYNAVATAATHGIWGGQALPGHYPSKLAPIYDRLAEQFEQCRRREIGDIPVAPLPTVDGDHGGPSNLVGAA